MAQGLVDETRQAQPGDAAAASAPSAQTEALPPLVVTPELTAAVREVVASATALDGAFRAFMAAVGTPDEGKADEFYLVVLRRQRAAIAALVREVAGEPDGAAQP